MPQLLDVWESDHGPSYLMEFANLDEELRYLRKMVSKYRQSPVIRDLAVSIVKEAGVPIRDKRGQAIAIGKWVQEHVYYVHELPERFQVPTETLRAKAGDCDDMTTLVCSMLESLGIPSLLVCMKIDGKWKHIFPAALSEKTGAVLALDATMRFPVGSGPGPVEWATQRGKAVALKIV